MQKEKIIVIVGPTASGKSTLAVEIASKYKGEIISADSRQVYKGLDIGAGKITKQEMRGIPHHLLNVASPRRTFTVAQFQKLGSLAIRKILAKKKLPIVCGGTGFYIDALLYNFALPSIPPNTALRRKLEKKSAAELFKELKKRDPLRARNIDRFNKRRLIRALEIIHATKKPVPTLKKESQYDVLKIGVAVREDILKKQIEARYRSWFKQGLLKEVAQLKKNGVGARRMDELGLEYKWVNLFLEKKISREEIDKNSLRDLWHYAKRQMTWFKRDKEIHWINPTHNKNRVINLIVKKFLSRHIE